MVQQSSIVKRQISAICLFMFCFYSCMASSAYSQDMKIDGKDFQVTNKSRINSDIEYYSLKDKSIPNAANQTYIKTNGAFNKTVFSQKEIKAFLAGGTISSLGRIAEKEFTRKLKTRKIKYIDKGTAKVFFLIEKGSVKFREFTGNLEDFLAMPNDDGPGGESEKERCHTGCEDKYDIEECEAEGFLWGQCALWLLDCYDRCDDAFPSRPNPGYSIPTSKLQVKIK